MLINTDECVCPWSVPSPETMLRSAGYVAYTSMTMLMWVAYADTWRHIDACVAEDHVLVYGPALARDHVYAHVLSYHWRPCVYLESVLSREATLMSMAKLPVGTIFLSVACVTVEAMLMIWAYVATQGFYGILCLSYTREVSVDACDLYWHQTLYWGHGTCQQWRPCACVWSMLCSLQKSCVSPWPMLLQTMKVKKATFAVVLMAADSLLRERERHRRFLWQPLSPSSPFPHKKSPDRPSKRMLEK